MSLLKVEKLSIRVSGNAKTNVPEKCLLKPISFELNKTERLVILGQTGAGKSLIVQAIMGTLPEQLMSYGQLQLFDQLIENNGLQQRLHKPSQQRSLWGIQISSLPQEPWNALDPLMPVGEQLTKTYHLVAKRSPERNNSPERKNSLERDNSPERNNSTEPKYSRHEAQNQAHKQLSELGLAPHSHRRVGQLSGGMSQRVALACAMAGGASLLLADEPTKGLDASRRDQAIQQLMDQTAEGALLLITHDVEVARQINGRVLVIKDGELVEQGDSQSMFLQPQHDYTKQLIAAAPANWEEKVKPSIAPLTKQTQTGQLKTKPPALTLVPNTVLSTHQLSIGRGERQLISDLNLTINAGEVIGVMGDSGCGKSTLGDTLLGLIPAFSGQMTRHGLTQSAQTRQTPVSKHQVEQHRWQKLYQDPTAAVPHSVSLQVLLNDVVKKYAIKPKAIRDLMHRLALDDALLQRSASHVSGGELQRFCMLRALLLKPVFLFADEPTSRLDPITAKEVSALLVDVAKETDCAIMLVSHDQHLIKKRCDRVIEIPNT